MPFEMEEHMILAELHRAKRIRVCETELLKLYMQAGDVRMHGQITQVVEAAMEEGAMSERYKEFYKS